MGYFNRNTIYRTESYGYIIPYYISIYRIAFLASLVVGLSKPVSDHYGRIKVSQPIAVQRGEISKFTFPLY